jgi:hypothetical protein
MASVSVRHRTSRGRPRTIGATSQSGGSHDVVCAVTESRGVSATVGICFVNLTTGKINAVLFLYNVAFRKALMMVIWTVFDKYSKANAACVRFVILSRIHARFRSCLCLVPTKCAYHLSIPKDRWIGFF